MRYQIHVSIICLAALLAGCQSLGQAPSEPKLSADEQAQQLFESIFDEWLAHSPTFQTWLGIKTDYGRWDDISVAAEEAEQRRRMHQLERLRAIDPAGLSDDVALSYRLMEERLKQGIEYHRWRHHNYPVNQMFGWHSSVPSLLINQHSIANVEDAEAYISRLNGVPQLFDQLVAGLELRAEKGIIPPRFVFPKVIEDSRNLISGFPFDDSEEDTTLLADFKSKLKDVEFSDERSQLLIEQAEAALIASVKPAYESLVDALKSLEQRADDRAGVWKFPDGEAFYDAALRRTTTTALTAQQIHEIGLAEVARIHAAMEEIKREVGFTGDLQAFFQHLEEDDSFYYQDSAEGRAQYLADTQQVIDGIKSSLDRAFLTVPRSPLKVKPVEAFREKSAGKAFYQSPPPDGSRPGIYYVNLHNMREMPKYELEALVYHEGLPGHHLQLSIAAEMDGVPRFRKYGGYTAYTEGWGLYAELLPKGMGFYQDPYSDFGRLAMELWRACRLVVDTGLHAKRWSREQAIDYLVDNMPIAQSGARRQIERYIVMPSQATAYKIGMLKIVELREKAREALGDRFDIREYHEKVLKLGAVPLNILEEEIDSWILERRGL